MFVYLLYRVTAGFPRSRFISGGEEEEEERANAAQRAVNKRPEDIDRAEMKSGRIKGAGE